MRKYELELRKLKSELQAKDKMMVISPNVQRLEEEKRRAEDEKNAAYNALEQRS